jgi:hypothetical protein
VRGHLCGTCCGGPVVDDEYGVQFHTRYVCIFIYICVCVCGGHWSIEYQRDTPLIVIFNGWRHGTLVV